MRSKAETHSHNEPAGIEVELEPVFAVVFVQIPIGESAGNGWGEVIDHAAEHFIGKVG